MVNVIHIDENDEKNADEMLKEIKQEATNIFDTIKSVEDDELRHRIAHDLKAPKASIEGFINLLKMNVPREAISPQIPGLKNNIEKRKYVVKDYVDVHNNRPLITKKMNLQKVVTYPLEETKKI